MHAPLRFGPNAQLPSGRLWLGYGAILCLAAALRYTGLAFSESVPWGRPDEELFMVAGLRLFATEHAMIPEAGWPELWFRAHHVVQGLAREWWTLRYGEAPTLGCVFALAPDLLFVPMRVLAATLSVGTVALVMRLGYRIGQHTLGPLERHAVAMASGLFYAVNVLAMRDAHFAVSDQPLVFFLTWTFVAMAEGIARGRLRDFASCGIAFGLAIATKWTALTFGIVVVIGIAECFRRRPTRATVAGVVLGVAGLVAAFLVANPTFIDDPQPFLDGLRSHTVRFDPEAAQAISYDPAAPLVYGIERHPLVSFPFALGWPLTIAAALGSLACVTVWVRRHGLLTFLVGFWTVFFVAVVCGRTTLYFARYSLPAHPTACVAAALLVVVAVRGLARTLERRRSIRMALAHRRHRWALAGVVALLATEPTFRSIEYVGVLRRPDTRDRAVAWLRANAGDTPVALSGGYARPFAVEDHVADACEALLPPSFAQPRRMRLAAAPDRTNLVGNSPATWHPLVAELIGWSLSVNASRFDAEWVVVAQPWLPCGAPVDRFAAREPGACYREVRRFEPEGIECDAVWDDQDHFFAPLWGFRRPWSRDATERVTIGPSIVIYRNECEPGQ